MFDLTTLPRSPRQRTVRLVLALLLPFLAGTTQWAFSDQLTAARWPLFFPVLLLAPLIGGLWGGIGATLISALLVWYFFLPPPQSWLLTTTGNAIALVLFVATGLAFSAFVQRLRDSEERYRTVFDRAGDGIVIFDAQGRVVDVNAAACQLGGLPRTVMVGAYIGDLIDGYAPDAWSAADATMLRQREFKIERTLRRRDGTLITVEAVGTRLQNQQRLALTRDVTERKQLETALRENEERLERLVTARTAELAATVAELERANAGKDAFLAAVSHELRTPLTGIFSMAELLEAQTRGPLNDVQQRYVEMMLTSARRLQAMIESILLFTSLLADKRPIQWEHCRLGELCDIALRTFAPLAAAKQQVIEQVYDPPDIAIESDAQAIVHVVRLLLDNAVKFTPAGGSIRLHVTAETAGACIAIADTGIGMSEEQVAALFRPFQQGDQRLERQYDGLGLSLAYVGEMVARLDGALIVTSALGAGSRFEVRLPWRAAGPLVSENSEK